ncbi:unnamed protein product [Microthlaspi erraticum]|uniref:Acetyltransferase n=1 Tax=Microthlaspi erraticum TaxID=1685480 RepID=A0A6D2KSW7_9BRAS|nr:unnamed protein product [Microthlaspi erraticum]
MEESAIVLSTSIIRPRNVNLSGRVNKIHLTPWDLLVLRIGYVQRGLLLPKPNPKIDLISRLKNSLSIALDHFYPFAGQLVKVKNDDNTASFHINCEGGGHGVKFVHATAEKISIGDVLRYSGSVEDVFFRSFFPAYGYKNYQGVSNPLLMVQVTEMKDVIFIGVGYNHTVSDDNSIWMFIKTWSDICSKGSGIIGCPRLLHKGWFFDGIDYPIHIPDPETDGGRDLDDNSLKTSTVLREIVFHVTKENVLKLKAKANDEAGSTDVKISSLQTVLAHIWRSGVRHSGMKLEDVTHCSLPANMRHRLEPPFAEDCFGHFCPEGIISTTVRELLENGLGWSAMLINTMVGLQTSERVKASAEEWVKTFEYSVCFGGFSLFVSSSHRLDWYCNDFGWGKPITARAAPTYLSGSIVLLKGFDEGSLDLQACLPLEVMVNLLKDGDFLEYVNIA